jgi:hypothetical protein
LGDWGGRIWYQRRRLAVMRKRDKRVNWLAIADAGRFGRKRDADRKAGRMIYLSPWELRRR